MTYQDDDGVHGAGGQGDQGGGSGIPLFQYGEFPPRQPALWLPGGEPAAHPYRAGAQ